MGRQRRKHDTDKESNENQTTSLETNPPSSKRLKAIARKAKRKLNKSHPLVKQPSLPTSSDAVLHGVLSKTLPTRETIQKFSNSQQHSFLHRVATQTELIMQLIHDCKSIYRPAEDAVSMEEQLTSDMVRLRRLPLAKQYVEMTMWRDVRIFSRDRLAAAEALAYGRGKGKQAEGQLLMHRSGDSDLKFVSYRDAHMKGIVSRFRSDLEKIRQMEALDKNQASFLLSCLESGADLYGNLKCLDDSNRDKIQS